MFSREKTPKMAMDVPRSFLFGIICIVLILASCKKHEYLGLEDLL
jgi:hypothetical protein